MSLVSVRGYLCRGLCQSAVSAAPVFSLSSVTTALSALRDESEEPVPAPVSLCRRPLPVGGGDSPVSRRRHGARPRALGSLRGVQQRIDFHSARLSGDEEP